MNIEEIFEDKQKACITREILEALPEWFECRREERNT